MLPGRDFPNQTDKIELNLKQREDYKEVKDDNAKKE